MSTGRNASDRGTTVARTHSPRLELDVVLGGPAGDLPTRRSSSGTPRSTELVRRRRSSPWFVLARAGIGLTRPPRPTAPRRERRVAMERRTRPEAASFPHDLSMTEQFPDSIG